MRTTRMLLLAFLGASLALVFAPGATALDTSCVKVDVGPGHADVAAHPEACGKMAKGTAGAGYGAAREQCAWAFGNPKVPLSCPLGAVRIHW